MIDLLNKADDFTKNDNFVNKNCKGVISEGKNKEKLVLVTKTCPPGVALAGPDMSKVRVLIKFCTFRVENLFFEVIS